MLYYDAWELNPASPCHNNTTLENHITGSLPLLDTFGLMCRKGDGKMKNICHPQQGHANTKVTVGGADSQDFAMFWQLICHKCHSSPHQTIALLLWGGSQIFWMQKPTCNCEYMQTGILENETSEGCTGPPLDAWFVTTLGMFYIRRGQQSMTVKLFEISLPLLPLRALTFKTVSVFKQKDAKGKKKKKLKSLRQKTPKNCFWLAPPCLCVKLIWLSSLTFIFWLLALGWWQQFPFPAAVGWMLQPFLVCCWRHDPLICPLWKGTRTPWRAGKWHRSLLVRTSCDLGMDKWILSTLSVNI